MGFVTRQNVNDVVAYHALDREQAKAIEVIRSAGAYIINEILINTPECADRSSAIRHIRNAISEANSAIALRGLI